MATFWKQNDTQRTEERLERLTAASELPQEQNNFYTRIPLFSFIRAFLSLSPTNYRSSSLSTTANRWKILIFESILGIFVANFHKADKEKGSINANLEELQITFFLILLN